MQLTPVGTTVFQGVKAVDSDAGANGLVEYRVVENPGDVERQEAHPGRTPTVADGAGHFAINLPHQGHVTLVTPLDYEKVQRYLVTIVATVSTTFKLSRHT
ncbi:hypothetical protein AAG570_002681 [Ranatra chinensis]|uniref:Cadherin domain-containing protein n=1 Tax=Ranatra chinensis TaxID=642074 RepID=A0ABD0Y8A1_9HEMI